MPIVLSVNAVWTAFTKIRVNFNLLLNYVELMDVEIFSVSQIKVIFRISLPAFWEKLRISGKQGEYNNSAWQFCKGRIRYTTGDGALKSWVRIDRCGRWRTQLRQKGVDKFSRTVSAPLAFSISRHDTHSRTLFFALCYINMFTHVRV